MIPHVALSGQVPKALPFLLDCPFSEGKQSEAPFSRLGSKAYLGTSREVRVQFSLRYEEGPVCNNQRNNLLLTISVYFIERMSFSCEDLSSGA